MKRKQLALTLVVAVLLGLLCACARPEVTPSGSDATPAETSTTNKDALSGTNFDPKDPMTWYSDTTSYPTAEDIARIQPGMTLTEVFRIIGLPQRDVGSGKIIMEWERDMEKPLQIVFNKKSSNENLAEADRWVVMVKIINHADGYE